MNLKAIGSRWVVGSGQLSVLWGEEIVFFLKYPVKACKKNKDLRIRL
jgi:hypothetical protein